MFPSLVFHLVDSLSTAPPEHRGAGAALRVRLHPEFASRCPSVPSGVWLIAHRRGGDEGVVWLDFCRDRSSGEVLPLSAWHFDIRDPEDVRWHELPANGRAP